MESDQKKAAFQTLGRYAAILAVAWTAVIGISLFWNIYHEDLETFEVAEAQARAAYLKDVDYRFWNTAHGGVYVPVTEDTQPNPHLSVPERDIQTPSGRPLTLMNPAFMVRQVSELAAKQYGRIGHITSLKPIRPANAADPWETRALRAFEQGTSEISSVELINGRPYMRFMRPLATEKGCLNCHAAQGYQEGDIRGGISVSVPMEPFYVLARRHNRFEWMGHGFIWLLGLGGIGLGKRAIRRRITERLEADDALQVSERRYRTLFENLPIGLYRNTPGRKEGFLTANPAIARMFGYDLVEEFLQVSVADLYMDSSERKRFSDLLAAQGSVTRFELRLKRKDGKAIWGAVTADAVHNDAGEVDYFDGALEDITERKHIENALKQSEEKLRVIVENVGLGVVLINKRMEIEQVNNTLQGWYPTVDFAARPICHHVLEDVSLDVPCPECPAMETFRDGQVHDCVRTRAVGGRSVHFRHRASPVCDEAGRVVGVVQILEDITEREIARQRMEAAARLVSEISPISDRTELLNLVIHRATELLGADFGVFVELDPETGAIGAAYPANFPLAKIPEGTQVKGQGILAWITQGNAVFSADIVQEPQYVGFPDWHPTVGPCIGLPLRLLSKVLGLMLIGRERGKEPFAEADRNFALILAHHAAVAIDRTRRMEMLHTMSIVDELTGLHNRRGFLTLAEQQMKVAARAGKDFLLVFADLDGLKWINDTFGHAEGDAALRGTADVLRATFRESDIIARMGGDEFAAIAVFAPPPTAEMLVARLAENVAAHNALARHKFTLSISAGIIAYDPQAPCSMDELLTRADSLMYQQKRARQRDTR